MGLKTMCFGEKTDEFWAHFRWNDSQFPERKSALQEEWFEDPGVGPPTEVSGEADDGVVSSQAILSPAA